ncbi:MAG: DNA-binding protein [Betaproteobacteria bacterium RIFCSPLOWO2_02_FULL_62_17]|nr:MAG: DNA-binding protein [Betaproteobacteria bacterium RIFCSPLOWO2_02_FULL_62_17]
MERVAWLVENRQIAGRLREAALLLRAQRANPFRLNAYLKAADSVAGLDFSLRERFESAGIPGLDEIPAIGAGIAASIAEMLITERWNQLERLRGSTDSTALLQAVPGIGPELAHRIHEELHVDTLEQLEAAANDGRLEKIPGVGPRRAEAWCAALERMLGRIRERRPKGPADTFREPPVSMLLEVDREYREKAQAGRLPTISPRRFNPENKSWLPILHTRRAEWHFTALYSNTALAHRLGRVHDWVILYFYDHDHIERQRTVVTEPRGPLHGARVVRGREQECAALREDLVRVSTSA